MIERSREEVQAAVRAVAAEALDSAAPQSAGTAVAVPPVAVISDAPIPKAPAAKRRRILQRMFTESASEDEGLPLRWSS